MHKTYLGVYVYIMSLVRPTSQFPLSHIHQQGSHTNKKTRCSQQYLTTLTKMMMPPHIGGASQRATGGPSLRVMFFLNPPFLACPEFHHILRLPAWKMLTPWAISLCWERLMAGCAKNSWHNLPSLYQKAEGGRMRNLFQRHYMSLTCLSILLLLSRVILDNANMHWLEGNFKI